MNRKLLSAAIIGFCVLLASGIMFLSPGNRELQPVDDLTAASNPSPAPTVTPQTTASTEPTAAATPFATVEATRSVDPQQLFDEAKELYRRRQYDQAAVRYEEVIRQKPDLLEAHLDLGVCYQRLGRMEESLDRFKKALELNQNYAPTLYDLACYYAVSEDKQKAMKFLKMAIDLDPRAKQAAQREPDLISLRSSVDFQRLVGIK